MKAGTSRHSRSIRINLSQLVKHQFQTLKKFQLMGSKALNIDMNNHDNPTPTKISSQNSPSDQMNSTQVKMSLQMILPQRFCKITIRWIVCVLLIEAKITYNYSIMMRETIQQQLCQHKRLLNINHPRIKGASAFSKINLKADFKESLQ